MLDTKISTKNLCKSFDGHLVLDGINLDIKSGKSFVIIGGSGSGKSVLIKTMIGLIKPSSGEVNICGFNPFKISSFERRELMQKCGFLFQSGALFDSLNVFENITFFAKTLHNLDVKKCKELAERKLQNVGLNDRVMYLYPSELSGGMQKRVSLARTIAIDPEIIFFDEPTTGLDPIMSNIINDLIKKIHKETSATCITITHDMNTVFSIADEIAMLYDGKIIWQGSSSEIKNSKNKIVSQFINGNIEGPIQI